MSMHEVLHEPADWHTAGMVLVLMIAVDLCRFPFAWCT